MKFNFWSWKKFFFAIIITLTVFVAHTLSSFLEQLVVKGLWYGWMLLFLWYLTFVYTVSVGYFRIVGVKL